jgi:hypothetical protein
MFTWNTLPGSGLYPVKRGLEKIALALVTPSMEVTAQLRARLIDRRFEEANTLLVQSSQTQGFTEFDSEVESAKTDILKKAQDENSDERIVEQEINDLLAKLEKYNLELEAQKQTYIAYNPQQLITPQPTTSTIVIPGKNANQPAKSITYNAPVPVQQPQTNTISPVVVIQQVNQSQGNLNTTIDQLRQEQERLQQQILAQQLKLQQEQEDRIKNQQTQPSHTSTPTPTPTPTPASQTEQPQPSQQPSQEPSHEPEVGRTGFGHGNPQPEESIQPQPSQPPAQAAPPAPYEAPAAAPPVQPDDQPQEPAVNTNSEGQNQ